jgi:hypothetical protein
LHELALGVCARDGIDLRFNHRETTSVALRGASIPERDEQAMTITPGDSSEHRPDRKPAVLALRVAHDGGIPVVRQRWDGQTSDIESFPARAQAWRVALPQAPHPRDRIAASTRDHDDHATPLRHLGFSTRLSHTMGAVAEAIPHARAVACGHRLDDHPRYPRLERCHDGMAQRWLGVSSPAASERAAGTLNHARPRASEALHKPRFHLHATRFATPEAAPAALTAWAKGWRDHQVDAYHLRAPTRDARQGRPTPRLPVTAIDWPIPPHVQPAEAAIEHQQPRHAGFVLGPHRGTHAWQETEISTADQRQSQVEGGFRFRNDPRFGVSALVVQTPCRLQGLLRGMTLAFLV